jgi:hypothetical protein
MASAKSLVTGIDQASVLEITERIETLETLLQGTMASLSPLTKETDARLESFDATFQEIKKALIDIRVLVRALGWAERFPCTA